MKVLFVEDDPMNRRVVKAMLEVAGAPMDEADSGAAGLAMVDREAYDLILMDLRMPGMDGITAIQKIRERGDDKGKAPIIVVTADTAPDLRAACIAAGANDFMMKPVAMNALFDMIARILVEGAEG
jgi:CheY-like chemotaxis protein